MLNLAEAPSVLEQVLYSSLSFPLFTFGLVLILLPALVGKASAFRFIFGSKVLTFFC